MHRHLTVKNTTDSKLTCGQRPESHQLVLKFSLVRHKTRILTFSIDSHKTAVFTECKISK
jgi:hypothetical protein